MNSQCSYAFNPLWGRIFQYHLPKTVNCKQRANECPSAVFAVQEVWAGHSRHCQTLCGGAPAAWHQGKDSHGRCCPHMLARSCFPDLFHSIAVQPAVELCGLHIATQQASSDDCQWLLSC